MNWDAVFKIECQKCEGKGKFEYYAHMSNGDCFSCEGKGYLLYDEYKTSKYLKKYPEAKYTRIK